MALNQYESATFTLSRKDCFFLQRKKVNDYCQGTFWCWQRSFRLNKGFLIHWKQSPSEYMISYELYLQKEHFQVFFMLYTFRSVLLWKSGGFNDVPHKLSLMASFLLPFCSQLGHNHKFSNLLNFTLFNPIILWWGGEENFVWLQIILECKNIKKQES